MSGFESDGFGAGFDTSHEESYGPRRHRRNIQRRTPPRLQNLDISSSPERDLGGDVQIRMDDPLMQQWRGGAPVPDQDPLNQAWNLDEFQQLQQQPPGQDMLNQRMRFPEQPEQEDLNQQFNLQPLPQFAERQDDSAGVDTSEEEPPLLPDSPSENETDSSAILMELMYGSAGESGYSDPDPNYVPGNVIPDDADDIARHERLQTEFARLMRNPSDMWNWFRDHFDAAESYDYVRQNLYGLVENLIEGVDSWRDCPPQVLVNILRFRIRDLEQQLDQYDIDIQEISGNELAARIENHRRRAFDVLHELQYDLTMANADRDLLRDQIIHLDAELTGARLRIQCLQNLMDDPYEANFMAELQGRIAGGEALNSTMRAELEAERQANDQLQQRLADRTFVALSVENEAAANLANLTQVIQNAGQLIQGQELAGAAIPQNQEVMNRTFDMPLDRTRRLGPSNQNAGQLIQGQELAGAAIPENQEVMNRTFDMPLDRTQRLGPAPMDRTQRLGPAPGGAAARASRPRNVPRMNRAAREQSGRDDPAQQGMDRTFNGPSAMNRTLPQIPQAAPPPQDELNRTVTLSPQAFRPQGGMHRAFSSKLNETFVEPEGQQQPMEHDSLPLPPRQESIQNILDDWEMNTTVAPIIAAPPECGMLAAYNQPLPVGIDAEFDQPPEGGMNLEFNQPPEGGMNAEFNEPPEGELSYFTLSHNNSGAGSYYSELDSFDPNLYVEDKRPKYSDMEEDVFYPEGTSPREFFNPNYRGALVQYRNIEQKSEPGPRPKIPRRRLRYESH